MKYAEHFSPVATPQSESLVGRESDMAENRAGGFAFTVDKWTQLERFMVLGSEGSTYYATEREMTVENACNVCACIAEDGELVVEKVLAYRVEDRCPKMPPLLFVLGLCFAQGDLQARTRAGRAAEQICAIPTHWWMLLSYVRKLRGTIPGTLKRAINRWIANRTPDQLAYHMVKYRQREGWTWRDMLRITRRNPSNSHCGKELTGYAIKPRSPAPHPLIEAFERVQVAEKPDDVCQIIGESKLPWECVPTKWLKDKAVCEALLHDMPMTATIRQLGRLTAAGLFEPMSTTEAVVVNRLRRPETMRKARLHPIQILSALSVYAQGHGERGDLTWEPNQKIVDALNDAFYAAFAAIEPTGKRFYLGVDVSGSMDVGTIAGVPGLTPRKAAAVMSLVTAATESSHYIAGFSRDMVPLNISPKQRIDDVCNTMAQIPFGRTDCAQPMLDALNRKIEVDAFVIYTDNETWCGGVHPVQALAEYRRKMGIPAKLIVVAFDATKFSIADPKDGGMMDVVGFDSAAPQIISGFVRSA